MFLSLSISLSLSHPPPSLSLSLFNCQPRLVQGLWRFWGVFSVQTCVVWVRQAIVELQLATLCPRIPFLSPNPTTHAHWMVSLSFSLSFSLFLSLSLSVSLSLCLSVSLSFSLSLSSLSLLPFPPLSRCLKLLNSYLIYTRHFTAVGVPAGSPSRGGDVVVNVFDTKPTELAHFFLFCSCVCFCLYGPFNCISFHKFSRQLSAFSVLPVLFRPYWSFQLYIFF